MLKLTSIKNVTEFSCFLIMFTFGFASSAFALKVNYGLEISLPVCYPMPPASVFKAPVQSNNLAGKYDFASFHFDLSSYNWEHTGEHPDTRISDFGPVGSKGWTRKADFGGGNFLFGLNSRPALYCGNISKYSTTPQWSQRYEYFGGDFPIGKSVKILEMTSLSDSVQESRVRAQVSLSQETVLGKTFLPMPSKSVYLTLSYSPQDVEDWEEAGYFTSVIPAYDVSKPGPHGVNVFSIEADIPANSIVKMKLFVKRTLVAGYENWRSTSGTPHVFKLHLHEARIFGGRCFPDFSNPGSCL